ncbi:hypothetical protein BaRGS_00007261 [Batillaria attramentaria]|uniref:PLAT domain-containing protein n=1 Tax=Batillaria attramentaria TaxID=370345 RepID=A0ABD0LQ49_9CAEN
MRLSVPVQVCLVVFAWTANANPRPKRATVCYNDLGCFSNGSPFQSVHRPISFTPDSPSDIATTYTVCTRQDSSGTTIDATNFGSIGTTTFDGARPTKFMVHGFAEFHNQKYQDMKDALLAQGDYNVILVEWKDGAATLYGQATANTRIVGAQIAQLIEYLQVSVPACLGSHVAGYAGERTPGLARITGLDPAEPYFQYTDKVVRLDPTDALFVDVIHTDVSSFFSVETGFGMSQPCGHVDYYPNGGYQQPGCSGGGLASVIGGIVTVDVVERVGCNHQRSVLLFTDTINAGQCPYRGYQCDSEDDFDLSSGKCLPCTGSGCGRMGFHADDVKPAAGVSLVKYYLNTGDKSPYCRYHYKVTLAISSGRGREERGNLFVKLTGSAASVGGVEITEESTYIKPGSSHSFIVTSPQELGPIQKVALHFEYDSIFWFLTPAIYLDRIDVYSGEAQTSASFCANAVKVEDDETEVFQNTC